jgi:hypothetical protein
VGHLEPKSGRPRHNLHSQQPDARHDPGFVFYNIADGSESYFSDLAHVQDANYMEAYFKNLKLALDIIDQEAGDDLAIPVTPLRPGIFTQDSSGVGQALAFNEDGSPNSAANPAAARSLLTIYATGLGGLTPAAADGSRSSGPLGIPAAPVRVTIDGLDAPIYFAGAAPAAISGLIQVNLQVPGSAASGDALPIVLIAGDIGSVETVTVAVK